MIKKILSIKNVGKFRNYSAAGDVELKKLTLIYSENGRGKTTLATIFKSLGYREPALIQGRKSIKGTGQPEVSLRLDGETTDFKESEWTKPYPNIEVFDSRFVSDNVYVGQHVLLDNRRDHYRFVIGEEGVKLSRRVDDLDTEIRQKASAIRDKGTEIQKAIIGGLSLKDFIELPKDADIDSKIITHEKLIQKLQSAQKIKEHKGFSKLTLPNFSGEDLEAILNRTLSDMTAEAAERVARHIAECTEGKGEPWLAEGVKFTKSGKCPFCGLSLDASELAKLYKSYFSEAYDNLKTEISEAADALKKTFSPAALTSLWEANLTNKSVLEFWSQHTKIHLSDFDFEAARTKLESIFSAASEALNCKKGTPLENVHLDGEQTRAISEYETLVAATSEYNIAVDEANAAVQAVKQEAGSGDLATALSRLNKFNNIKKRYEPQVDGLCQQYTCLSAAKDSLQSEKDAKKKELDEFSDTLLSKYEADINRFLAKMGAGFKITGSKTSFSGGKPSSDFKIEIEGVAIKIGDDKSPDDEPSFRNTLSDGDKSALAFAFFLSRLALDPQLPEKTVIIDDPLTSLDENRKTVTEQEVVTLAGKAAQVILLSHDPFFLDEVRSKCGRSSIELGLQKIDRVDGDSSHLREWDPTLDLLDPTVKDYIRLSDYIDNGPSGDLRDVARSIRTLLEGKLRRQFPKDIKATEWLGDMISRIRDSEMPPLNLIKTHVQELSEVNDFSSRYHHGPNSNADSEPINDGELKPFVQRTLQLYHSF